jgi:hypothetical protein
VSEQGPPPPLSQKVLDVLRALGDELERSLTPIVEGSLAQCAEVAFVQGTMGPHDVRGATVPPSTGHWLHVCLNVTSERLQGEVTLEMLTAAGTVLATESTRVTLPSAMPRRPRPVGLVSLLFAVPAELDWGAVVAARLSLADGCETA